MTRGHNISTLLVTTHNFDLEAELKSIITPLVSKPIQTATSFAQAREAIQKQSPDLGLVDASSNSQQALKLIEQSKQVQPNMAWIAIVPHDNREISAQVMRYGAQATLPLPLHPEEAALVVSNTIQTHTNPSPHTSHSELRDSDGFCGIVGTSSAMHKLFDLIKRLGEEGESSVLIQGESGVGKELVAKALHECSPRSNKNFVPVNCAAIPDSLLESELFGYEKGAFTGANQAKKGRLHHAHAGTLFLDEIGEMQATLQAKLLRVLQEKEFEPVGAIKPVPVDARIIAATNIDLEQAVQKGSFRTDLFYRLSVVPLHVPPLRKRTADIPLLLEKFAVLFNRGRQNKPKRFSPEAIQALKQYPWPGNVRELKNLVQRLCVLHRGTTIKLQDLPEEFVLNAPQSQNPWDEDDELSGTTSEFLNGISSLEEDTDFNSRVSEFEDRLILQALIATNGNKKQAAKRLNLKRTTLLEKIKKKDLDRVFHSLRKEGT